MPAIAVKKTIVKSIFLAAIALALTPLISPPLALILGAALVFLLGNPYEEQAKLVSGTLLKVSIVLMGFGMTGYRH